MKKFYVSLFCLNKAPTAVLQDGIFDFKKSRNTVLRALFIRKMERKTKKGVYYRIQIPSTDSAARPSKTPAHIRNMPKE